MSSPEQGYVSDDSVERTVSGKEPTFEVEFGCLNCGDEFRQQFGPKTNVSSKEDGAYVGACSTIGCRDCCGRVQCPTCELHKTVTITDRFPIEDVDEV